MSHILLLTLLLLVRPWLPACTLTTDTELFQLYRTLNDVSRDFDIPLVIPRLCVIGVQNAGKTSLLEVYAGIPLGFTSSETGTRCPVEYTFINDPKAITLQIEYEGRSVGEQELLVALKNHMDKIGSTGGGFSHEIVRVTIRSNQVSSIVMTDTPGLITSPDHTNPAHVEKALAVRRVVQQLARDPSYKLVAVLKCSEHAETMSDILILDGMMSEDVPGLPSPRLDWKRDTVIIVNQINKHMAERAIFGSPADVSRWVHHQQKGMNKYFVALKPDPEFVREKASADDVKKFLVDQPKLEAKLFADWKKTLTDRSPGIWDTSVDQYFSLANARSKIDYLFKTSFHDQIPSIVRELNEMEAKLEKEVKLARLQADRLDPDNYTSTLRNYAVDYADHLGALITAEMLRNKLGKDHTNYDSDQSTFTPSKYGKRWAEEIDLHHDKEALHWEFVIDPTQLMSKNHLKDLPLGDDLLLSLVGAAAMKRAMKMTSYFVYNMGMDDVKNDDIRSILDYNPHIDSPAVERAVSSLARAQLGKLRKGFRFLRSHILGVLASYSEIVRDFLLAEEYRHLANDDIVLSLCMQMSKMYMELLSEQLTLVKDRLYQNIEMYSNFLRTDLPIRTLMMMVVNPIQNRVLSTEEILKRNEDNEVVPPSKRKEKEEEKKIEKEKSFYDYLIPEESTEKVPGPEEVHGKSEVHLGEVAAVGATLKKQELPSRHFDPNDREMQKRETITAWQHLMARHSKLYGTADIVTGGPTAFLPMDQFTMDYNYIRDCAYELYVHYVFWIIFDLEMAVENYVIGYLPLDGSRKLKLRFMDLIAELKPEDLAKAMGTTKEEIEEHLVSVLAQQKIIMTTKIKLERAKFR